MTEPSPLEKLLLSDPPPFRPDTPHYEAVGRFVTWFANAETGVHILARKLSGMPDAKARIIFGGMRLADLTDIVRSMARLDMIPQTDYDEIDACLTQLNFIGAKRHALVHRSSNFFEDRIVVTNIQNSRSVQASEMEAFSIDQLSDMQTDLSRILLRIRYVADPSDFAHDRKQLIELVQLMRTQPWLHKHAPPKTPNLKPRAKSAKPNSRPLSSRERRDEAAKRSEK